MAAELACHVSKEEKPRETEEELKLLAVGHGAFGDDDRRREGLGEVPKRNLGDTAKLQAAMARSGWHRFVGGGDIGGREAWPDGGISDLMVPEEN